MNVAAEFTTGDPGEPRGGMAILWNLQQQNVPHLPHPRNPLSFCRRRNLGGFASQPARNHQARHNKATHLLLPVIPLTTNFGLLLPLY